jgi:hypothetical protein
MTLYNEEIKNYVEMNSYDILWRMWSNTSEYLSL